MAYTLRGTMPQGTTSQGPLLHSAAVPPNPQANLSGWFHRADTLWKTRRWLELRGTILTYRHAPNATPQWQADLRDCRITPGTRAHQLTIARPHAPPTHLLAPTIGDLKLWFTELTRVADTLHNFYNTSACIAHTDTAPVALATDKRSGHEVSVFTHQKGILSSPMRTRLTARDPLVIRASQTHSATLALLDLFEDSRAIYAVTERITGGTLAAAVSKSRCPSHLARCIMQQVLAAIAHLHTTGLVHGAVDARHVLLTTVHWPCPVKLLVHGVASRIVEETGRVPSEPDLPCAPEVLCFHRREPAADIFSAGLLLFSLLTDSLLFPVNNEPDFLSAVSLGPKGAQWDRLGDERHIIAKMVLEDPEKRPSAAQCLLHPWFQHNDGATADADGQGPASDTDFWAYDPSTVIMDFESSTTCERVDTPPRYVRDQGRPSYDDDDLQDGDVDTVVMQVRSTKSA